MKYKNYYKILGLSGPKVTDDEIKSAYRKLAKLYHPDINPGNIVAAEKFKDVNEAYQVLADEEAKRKYNRKYFAYSLKDVLSVSAIKAKIDESGSSEFVEMFVGKQEKKLSVKKKKTEKIKGENVEIPLNLTLREAFAGVTKKIIFPSTDGKTKTITVKIPSGIVNGGKIRIKGQGKQGKGKENNGDLLIRANIVEDKKFKLENADLIFKLPITPVEAVLGTSVDIDGLDTKFNLRVPEGVSQGEQIKIEKQGYYAENGVRGDFIAKIEIVIPKEISEKERNLYKELQKITSFEPRKD